MFRCRRPTSRRRRLVLESLEPRLALSTTYTVTTLADASPPTGTLSLRQAIQMADADSNSSSSSPDAIDFAVTGTIDLATPLPAISGNVRVEGPGSSSLTLIYNGTTKSPILATAAGSDVSISGISFDGRGTGAATAGAISVGSNASATISGVLIEHPIFNTDAAGFAGAILADQGGASVTVNDSTIEDGMSSAIVLSTGSLLVNQSSVLDQTTPQYGGGILADPPAGGQASATVTVVDSTFANNFANVDGGAIALVGSVQATIVDSTFEGNVANGTGGAISLTAVTSSDTTAVTSSPSLTVVGSTIDGNQAESPNGGVQGGSGIAQLGSTPIVLIDTIVAGNLFGSSISKDIAGPVSTSSAYNLIGDGTGITGLALGYNQGNQIGTGSAPINPLLGPLQNNGGPTMTQTPLPGSPAIGAGGPAMGFDTTYTTDQAGNPWVDAIAGLPVAYGGDGRDIGAFEVITQTPTVLTVDTTADANPPTGTLSLREAIEAADGTLAIASLPASQVQAGSAYVFEVKLAVTGTIALASDLPSLTSDFEIVGPGASSLTVDAAASVGGTAFTLATAARGTISGLTIDGSQTAGTTGIEVGTGADLAAESDAFVHYIEFGESGPIQAIAGGSNVSVELSYFSDALGNGIVSFGGALSVDSSTFSGDNALTAGGAIESGVNAAGFGGQLSITRSEFDNNFTILDGGAVAIFVGSTATIADSTFSGNLAVGGGAILLANGGEDFNALGGSLTILRSTIVGNGSTGGTGAGIDSQGNPIFLQDSIVAENVDLASKAPDDLFGAFSTSSSNDLIGDGANTTGLTSGVNGLQIGTASAPLNPLLGPLQNNGGPTKTLAPLATSPALNTGSGTIDTGTDQRGVVRGKVIDIGAYQATPSRLLLVAGPATAGQADTLGLEETDSLGQPVYGDTISLTTSDARAALPGSVTLLDGVVSLSATFETAGSQTVTATDAAINGSPTVLEIAVSPGAPASGTIASGDGQSAIVGAAFGQTMSLIVHDAYRNVVAAGTSITYSVVASNGATASFAGGSTSVTVTTNAAGVASAPLLTAGTTAGSFAVLASVAGGGPTLATFHLTDTAAPAISVASTPTVDALQNVTTALVVVATFTDPAVASFPSSAYTATIIWGDGSGAASATVQISGVTIAVLGSHTFESSGNFAPIVTLQNTEDGQSAQAAGVVKVAADVSSVLGVRRGGLVYNFATGEYTTSITLTNDGTSALSGELDLVIAGLPTAVTLANASGTTGSGSPEILVPLSAPLLVGQSITIQLAFKDPGFVPIIYTLRAYDLI